jgi:AP-4 complex subunit mu-1
VSKGTAEIFFRNVKFWQGNQQDAPPVFNLDGINYLYMKKNGLFFLITTVQ